MSSSAKTKRARKANCDESEFVQPVVPAKNYDPSEDKPAELKKYSPTTDKGLVIQLVNAIRDAVIGHEPCVRYLKQVVQKTLNSGAKIGIRLMLNRDYQMDRYDVIMDLIRRYIWSERENVAKIIDAFEKNMSIDENEMIESRDKSDPRRVILRTLLRIEDRDLMRSVIQGVRTLFDIVKHTAQLNRWDDLGPDTYRADGRKI